MKVLGIVCLAAVSVPLIASSARAESIDREFHENFDVSPGVRLDLESGDGDVEFVAWEKDIIEIDVVYYVDVKGLGLRTKPDFDVSFDRQGDTIRVVGRETGLKGFGFWSSKERRHFYSIHAPAYLVLDIKGDDGDVEITGWRAEIDCEVDDGDLTLVDIRSKRTRLRAEDGDLDIEGFEGELDVAVDDGDIEVTDCVSDSVRIRTEDGDVLLDRCEGNFEISVDDGQIDLRQIRASRVDVKTSDGGVEVELLSAVDLKLDVETDDGDVVLSLGPDISAAFAIDTHDGRVRVTPEEWIRTDETHRVTGQIGAAGGQIQIRTNDGNVTIH